MADAADAEVLRQYLLALKPQARALLSEELERATLRGEAPPGASTILEQLRNATRIDGRKLPRVGNPQRLFFDPAEPFLVDGLPHRKLPGRIARTSLNPIWNWICRDLMPEGAKAFVGEVQLRLSAKDDAGAEQIARTFQDQAEQRLRDRLEVAKSDDKVMRRLAVRIGTPHALDEARELAAILRARDVLAVIASRLPASIGNFGDSQVANVSALLTPSAGRDRDDLLHALLIVRNRLGSPWQLIRLAIHAAGSDAAARLAATPFAPAVEIALTDLDLMVVGLRDTLRAGRVEVTDLLKQIHGSIRALRAEIDFSVDSVWGRQLAAVCAETARLLQGEIDALPGQVRRLLRPRDARDSGGALDAGGVAEIEAKVGLAAACHTYAAELAISEAARRIHSDLQHYFDGGTQMLIDRLRASPPAERAFRQSQVDAAIRFCAKLFGADYAGLLAKAAEVAARGEKRAAKA